MRGLMAQVFLVFAHACHMLMPFKLWVICTIVCSLVLKGNCSSASAELGGESPRLKNSYILKKFQAERLNHLEAVKQEEMMKLLFQFVNLFEDLPS